MSIQSPCSEPEVRVPLPRTKEAALRREAGLTTATRTARCSSARPPSRLTASRARLSLPKRPWAALRLWTASRRTRGELAILGMSSGFLIRHFYSIPFPLSLTELTEVQIHRIQHIKTPENVRPLALGPPQLNFSSFLFLHDQNSPIALHAAFIK